MTTNVNDVLALKHVIVSIRRVRSHLNASRDACGACGVMVCRDRDQWQADEALRSAIARVERAIRHISGTEGARGDDHEEETTPSGSFHAPF